MTKYWHKFITCILPQRDVNLYSDCQKLLAFLSPPLEEERGEGRKEISARRIIIEKKIRGEVAVSLPIFSATIFKRS
jgi:hypothetical protein